MTLHLRAPAKLNLALRVLGRRPDGYHELETIFERIDLADELAFQPQPRGLTVTCDDPTLDCGPANLVTQAAALLQQTCRTAQGVAIHLTKLFPIAGGLGGGSSDAATTLIGLNRLWQLGLSRERVVELAARLGSDVPFFLVEEAAFAIGRGRGERCEPLAGPLPTLWHVLVVPDARLSTKEIYEAFDRRESVLTEPRASVTMSLHALRNGSLSELAKGLRNELEPEAIRRCPVIRDIQHALRATGCLAVLVSGSGPSVFGLCRDAAQAHQVARMIRLRLPLDAGDGREDSPAAWRVLVVKTAEAHDHAR